MNWLIIDDIIKNALTEDISGEDITTVATVSESSTSIVDLIAKEDGLVAGLAVFKRVYEILGDVEVTLFKKDGDEVNPGMLLAEIKGSTRNLLSGERVALNFLQRMSGIATLTNKYVQEISGTNAKLLDTRKTTPGLRILEKYSVKIGGGENHRFNLSDGVMLKDNHIAAAGGIKKAVSNAKATTSFVRKIEVEVENIDMLIEAIEADADIIMLDNMSISTMKEAVKIVGYRALTEASGNITLENIRAVAETGVDYISVGALTHSYKALDLSMKNLRSMNNIG
jgi:nicotinate-nucleotide pyrophosphorylase (carboxylating)